MGQLFTGVNAPLFALPLCTYVFIQVKNKHLVSCEVLGDRLLIVVLLVVWDNFYSSKRPSVCPTPGGPDRGVTPPFAGARPPGVGCRLQPSR